MAISRIEVNTNLLNNTISSMQADLQRIRNLTTIIYNDMNELDAMWDGKANLAFKQQFEKDRQLLIGICDNIDAYIDNLNFAKNEYNKCENTVSGIVDAIRI